MAEKLFRNRTPITQIFTYKQNTVHVLPGCTVVLDEEVGGSMALTLEPVITEEPKPAKPAK